MMIALDKNEPYGRFHIDSIKAEMPQALNQVHAESAQTYLLVING